ncbi:hypothetical protein [Ornithinimicrobium cerasi]|uniref:hypothetical protein n=1 Tax=Ornithinimicrobium cerasi TaxID=2248773 RepID=UPI000EFF7AA4|nr:hypothetical protein [Ornithinimicrobium cerasi]
MKKTAIVLAALALTATAAVPAAAKGHSRPDTGCMQAGIATLQGAGLMGEVAKNGLPVSLALALDVAPRDPSIVPSLPETLPLSVVLADHRAGGDSIFIYPWTVDGQFACVQ